MDEKIERYKELCTDYVNLYKINCKNKKNPESHCDVIKNILDDCFTFKTRKIKMYTKEKERRDN
jgi:hypothetical protein